MRKIIIGFPKVERHYLCDYCNYKDVKIRREFWLFNKNVFDYYWIFMNYLTLIIISILYPIIKKWVKIDINFKNAK